VFDNDQQKAAFTDKNELRQSSERDSGSRFAFLTPPSVARWAAIPLRLIVVAGALLLDLLFRHFKLEFPDRSCRKSSS